jgi:hypothetical protein
MPRQYFVWPAPELLERQPDHKTITLPIPTEVGIHGLELILFVFWIPAKAGMVFS